VAIVEVDRVRRTCRSRTGLWWRQREDTEAVRGVSFHIEAGETFYVELVGRP
jgi:ABC-type glutathione transport system ATPase component